MAEKLNGCKVGPKNQLNSRAMKTSTYRGRILWMITLPQTKKDGLFCFKKEVFLLPLGDFLGFGKGPSHLYD